MSLTIVTVPDSNDPVLTLAQAKAQSRVTNDAEDSLIADAVLSATQYAEKFTSRQFVTATWKLTLDRFPRVIRLPLPPTISIGSVKYVDTAGTQQTLDVSKYQFDGLSEPGRIVPAWGEVWPDTRDELNAVTVEFDAGYGDASEVPQSIKQAMLLIVAHGFDDREEGSVPPAAEKLLLQERMWLA